MALFRLPNAGACDALLEIVPLNVRINVPGLIYYPFDVEPGGTNMGVGGVKCDYSLDLDGGDTPPSDQYR